MACIRKRRGKWVVDYRETWIDAAGARRVRRRWVMCDTRKAAEDVLSDTLKAVREQDAPAVDPDIRVAEYAEHWLRTIANTVKERSLANYDATLRLQVLPAFGSLKVRECRRSRIKVLLAEKLTVLSPSSVRLVYAVLHTMLASAVDDGMLTGNPAAGLGRKFRLHRGAAERQETMKALTREQLSAFLDAAAARFADYWPFFLLLARTGLRFGEALALQWDDLDLVARTARVARTFSNDRLQASPKGNRGRTVDLSPQLVKALHRLHVERKAETLRCGWPEVPVWVFCDEAGRPIREQRIERAFKRVLKAAKLPGHFTPHSLRHTYASLLLSDSVSPVYVQRQLGHATIRLTVDLYGRWLPMENRGAVDRLDDRLPKASPTRW